MLFDFATKVTQHSLQIRRQRVAQFMPECQYRYSSKKWLTFVRNRWLTLLRNKWLSLLRNGWLSI